MDAFLESLNFQFITDLAIVVLRILIPIMGVIVVFQCYSSMRRQRRDEKPLIINHNYFLKSAVPGLTPEIAEHSIYDYLENTLHMTIVNSKRVMTVEKITQIDEKYLHLDANDYNCMAVVSSHTYNSDGVMFEFTQSRHRPDYFRFQDNAVRKATQKAGIL